MNHPRNSNCYLFIYEKKNAQGHSCVKWMLFTSKKEPFQLTTTAIVTLWRGGVDKAINNFFFSQKFSGRDEFFAGNCLSFWGKVTLEGLSS